MNTVSVSTLIDLPPRLDPLAAFLGEALARVQAAFDTALASDLPPVARLVGHVERYRGKMLRPTLTLLAGLAAHPRHDSPPNEIITESHIAVAALCEMVHMATLVHDDVLDDAATRRRGLTVNRLHGNEAAIILGDHLLATAYRLGAEQPTPRASRAVGRASVEMCSGELLQLHHRGDWSLDEPTYFEIVERKTAALIATAAELGADASGAPAPQCARLAAFGRRIGVAFQIQDDILDLTAAEAQLGKPVGKDLEKGKLTLPLIHHLATAPVKTRGRTLRLLEESAAGGARPLAEVTAALSETASIEYAAAVAGSLVRAGKRELEPFPATVARELLERMADAVVARSM